MPARFIALTALLAASAAQAGRPLVTETADANPAGTCDVESAVFRETASGAPSTRSWDTVLACGIGHDTQLGAGYERARLGDETAQRFGLGGKTALLPMQDGRAGWGLGYRLVAVKDPGLALRTEEVRIVGLVSKEITSGVLGHANLGWSYSRSEKQSTTQWWLGVETTSDLSVAADVFGDDRGRPWVSTGIGYLFGGGFSANLSYALQFDNPRVKLLGVGVKLVF